MKQLLKLAEPLGVQVAMQPFAAPERRDLVVRAAAFF